MRALIVEPSHFHQHIIGSKLLNAGFFVEAAESSENALNYLMTRPTYSLVCVSMYAGEIDGLETCRRIREFKTYKKTPIVLITGQEENNSAEKALQAGFTDVFFKANLQPFDDFSMSLAHALREQGNLAGRILYVEDSPLAATVTKNYLSPLGLTIDHFESAEEALESFKHNEYDLILTDVLLKGKLNGMALIREIRQSKSRVPILVLSGHEDLSRKVEILRSGANDYVSKPVVEEELIARLRTLIHNKRLIDEVENQKKQLQKLALTDHLTSLYNRHVLMDIAPKMIAESIRHDYPLSLMVFDIDNFKKINDTYGHVKGDEVLMQIGAVLKAFGRKEDLAARTGGEEFMLILSHCSLSDAGGKAEELRKAIEKYKPADIVVTVSIGVTSLLESEAEDFEALYSVADKAMYKAKSTGKNRVVVSSN